MDDQPPAAPVLKASHDRGGLVATLVITCALIFLKTCLEDMSVIKRCEDWTYRLLQGRLIDFGTTDSPPILVVDIGKISRVPSMLNGRFVEITPRDSLMDVIEPLADLGAKAIALDIDFSPEHGQPVHPKDPEFFQWCLDCSKHTHIPIALGIFRADSEGSEWLGDDHYMSLAAFIGGKDADRSVYWKFAKNGYPLRGISAALAGLSWEQLLQNKESVRNFFVRPTSIVAFRWLKRIRDDVCHTLNPEALRDEAGKIRGRMVILGDANGDVCGNDPKLWSERDCFHVTGVKEPVRGVFLHACAATTIAQREPIFELTRLGRIVLDAVLAAIIIIGVEGSCRLRSTHDSSSVHPEWKLDMIFTFLLILIVIIVGVGLIQFTRLLWTDFLIACCVLLLQLAIDTRANWTKVIRWNSKVTKKQGSG